MEYIFGSHGEHEILKTKGEEHTNLAGFNQILQEYPDQTITDCFRVVRKYNSAVDVEGNCYDWYEIDCHYRERDKSRPIEEKIDSIEDAMCGPNKSWQATRDFEPGELVTIDGGMYRVVLPVFAGTEITVGTNVEATTLGAEITRLSKEETV